MVCVESPYKSLGLTSGHRDLRKITTADKEHCTSEGIEWWVLEDAYDNTTQGHTQPGIMCAAPVSVYGGWMNDTLAPAADD